MAKISTSIVSLARRRRRSAAICLLASSLGGSPHETVAQGLTVDRWLITGVDSVPSTNPLGESMQWGFPDRNLTVGPGLWTLVREDGRSKFDFSDHMGPGKAALAHVYLKAPTDLTVHMSVKTESCVSISVWLNGQLVPEPMVSRDVRLAGGWNTFLAVLSVNENCVPSLAVDVSTLRGPVNEDEEGLSPSSVRVQASRPPGVRPNFPQSIVTVTTPTITGLAWGAGHDDLSASFRYSLSTWGGPGISASTVGRAPTSFKKPEQEDTRGAKDELSPPSDPDGQRARMVRQLLGPPTPLSHAPMGASAKVSIAGESYIIEADELTPAEPREVDGMISFRKLRDAALREDGVVAEIKWVGGDRKVTGRVSAASVLRALHGELDVSGLTDRGDGFAVGAFRVPDALAGFTIQAADGDWLVNGRSAPGGALCDPCKRGERFELGFRSSSDAKPQVHIINRGWPDVTERTEESAIEWLRVLEGDNRKYRERVGD